MLSFSALKKITESLINSSKLRIPEQGQKKLTDILLMTLKWQFLNSHLYWNEWTINHIEGMIKICNEINHSTNGLEMIRAKLLHVNLLYITIRF